MVLLTGHSILVKKDADVLHVYSLLSGTQLLKCLTHSNGTIVAQTLSALNATVVEVTLHVYDEAGHPLCWNLYLFTHWFKFQINIFRIHWFFIRSWNFRPTLLICWYTSRFEHLRKLRKLKLSFSNVIKLVNNVSRFIHCHLTIHSELAMFFIKFSNSFVKVSSEFGSSNKTSIFHVNMSELFSEIRLILIRINHIVKCKSCSFDLKINNN